MRSFGTIALGLVGAVALAAASSDVHDLTKDTFEPFVKEHDLVLAEFFAPWCGHCKALAPEYEEAATQLKEKDIALAKVDCTVEADLCASYGVEGYPTIKVFRGPDNVSPYGGARKAQAIVSYMTKQSMPAVSMLDKKSLEDFKTADKVVLVAFISADDKASNETFTSVANAHRDEYLFGATSDASLAKAEGVKQPAIVLYKTFDEGKNTFEDKFDKEAIETFAKVAAVPLVGEVGPETYAGYMQSGLPLAYIFAETSEERDQLSKELKPVAEKHKGAINFATIDAKAFGQHGSNLNLEVGKWPAFAIQDTVKNQKFPLDQAKKLTKKNVGAFVDDFVAGKVAPSIKSEPIPEKQDGPVTVIVALNYEDIVMDDDKDVLVEFYAPWCGHCKSLAPKYEELAALYSGSSQVVVAKVDATANDVPDEIQGFPTIKLFPAGQKGSPVTYSGSRTVEDLANFIRENGSHKVDAYLDADDLELRDVDDMPHQAPAATEKAKESAASASDKAKATAGSATDKAKVSASEATESAASATDKAKASAGSAAEKATGSAGSAAKAATDSAASAAGKATDSASSAAGKAASSAASASDKAKDSASSVAGKATDAASSATDAAASATDKAKASASSAAGKVKDSASSAADSAASATDKVKDSVSSVAGKATDAASSAADSAASASDKAKASASSAAGKAKDSASSVAGKATGPASSAADKAKASAGSATDKVAGAAGKATDSASSAVGKAADTASSASQGVKDKIKSKIVEAAEAVKMVVADDEAVPEGHDEL